MRFLMKLECPRQIFEKSSNMKFHKKIRPLGTDFFRANRHDVAVRSFANTPQNPFTWTLTCINQYDKFCASAQIRKGKVAHFRCQVGRANDGLSLESTFCLLLATNHQASASYIALANIALSMHWLETFLSAGLRTSRYIYCK